MYFSKQGAWTLNSCSVGQAQCVGFPGEGVGKQTQLQNTHPVNNFRKSLLKVGARLRVKWADLEFAFRVTTVFS